MTIVVEFNNVSKKYNLGMTRKSIPSIISERVSNTLRNRTFERVYQSTFWALRDVSFKLERGDSLALVGANGAGKSTILKILARITKATSGQIRVNGKISALIELGAGFHPDLTGRENIYLNGAILGIKRAEIANSFDQIVAFAELEKFIDTPLKRYSSGMAVRLGFAVAASMDPDVLLVDEVLAVGDVSFRLKCMARIQELLDNGTTLVFVSHNMGLVKAVCKKGLFIESGTTKCFGTSGEAIDAYNHVLNDQRSREFKGLDESPKIASNILFIEKVEVVGFEDNEEQYYLSSKAVKINVYYQAYEMLGEISADLHFFRSDGVGIIKIFSHIDQAIININRGSGRISVVLDPIQLVSGKYSVVATLKNRSGSFTFDYVFSNWFDVEDGQGGEGSDDLEAVFLPNRSWRHDKFNDGI